MECDKTIGDFHEKKFKKKKSNHTQKKGEELVSLNGMWLDNMWLLWKKKREKKSKHKKGKELMSFNEMWTDIMWLSWRKQKTKQKHTKWFYTQIMKN